MELRMFAGGVKVSDGNTGGELPDTHGKAWDGTQEGAQTYLRETRDRAHEAGSDDESWIGWRWEVFIGVTPDGDNEERAMGPEPIRARKPLATLID